MLNPEKSPKKEKMKKGSVLAACAVTWAWQQRGTGSTQGTERGLAGKWGGKMWPGPQQWGPCLEGICRLQNACILKSSSCSVSSMKHQEWVEVETVFTLPCYTWPLSARSPQQGPCTPDGTSLEVWIHCARRHQTCHSPIAGGENMAGFEATECSRNGRELKTDRVLLLPSSVALSCVLWPAVENGALTTSGCILSCGSNLGSQGSIKSSIMCYINVRDYGWTQKGDHTLKIISEKNIPLLLK